MNLLPAIPILRIFSEQKAREYYVDFLGFAVEWEHRFEDGMPLYLQIRRSDLVLHLSEHYGDASPGATIYVPVRDIAAFQGELAAKNYTYARPDVHDVPWGREMVVTDPFANRIRFCESNA